MKPGQLRDKTVDELKKMEADLSAEIFNLRFQVAYKQLDNPLKIRLARRDLARVKTVLADKQQSESKND